jgi:hypothetical protein
MEAWLKAHDELQEVIDLFFGVHYEQGMRETNRFLNVMQALETYHRLRSNEGRVYLRKRVIELVENGEPALDKLITRPELFAKWAKDSRNFYTHRESRPNQVIAREQNLILLTQSLLWLLRIHFMGEIGFTPTECKDLLDNNNRFKVVVESCSAAPWNAG